MFLLSVPTYLLWYTTMMDFHGQGTGGEMWDVSEDLGDRGFCEWVESEALASLIPQEQDSHESLWILLCGRFTPAIPQI